jgi:mevalonate kinase
MAAHCGRAMAAAEVSALVYQTEVLLHGTPSGVDNTVVAYEAPLCFRQGRAPEFVHVGAPLTLLVADTGIIARPRDAVGAVRAAWQAGPARYEALLTASRPLLWRPAPHWPLARAPHWGV